MKCPHCGKSIKGHDGGTKTFRELSPEQQRASIAKTARDLKEMREIYQASKPGDLLPELGAADAEPDAAADGGGM